MTATSLIIGETQRNLLRALREKATASPIDMLAVMEQIKTPIGYSAHIERMNDYSVAIPEAFMVTFTIETGHPCGAVRHMSMSSDRNGRTPTPKAVWMVCEELGFVGDQFDVCSVWEEKLGRVANDREGIAINVVQPIDARVAHAI